MEAPAYGSIAGAQRTFDAASVLDAEAAHGAIEFVQAQKGEHGAEPANGAAQEPAGMQALLQQLEAADVSDEDICD